MTKRVSADRIRDGITAARVDAMRVQVAPTVEEFCEVLREHAHECPGGFLADGSQRLSLADALSARDWNALAREVERLGMIAGNVAQRRRAAQNADGSVSAEEIAQALGGLDVDAVRDAIDEAAKLGLVTKHKGGRVSFSISDSLAESKARTEAIDQQKRRERAGVQ